MIIAFTVRCSAIVVTTAVMIFNLATDCRHPTYAPNAPLLYIPLANDYLLSPKNNPEQSPVTPCDAPCCYAQLHAHRPLDVCPTQVDVLQ